MPDPQALVTRLWTQRINPRSNMHQAGRWSVEKRVEDLWISNDNLRITNVCSVQSRLQCLAPDGGFLMHRATGPYAPTEDDDEVRETLERYRERRLGEIRSATETPERGFIPLEELRALAKGQTHRPERPG